MKVNDAFRHAGINNGKGVILIVEKYRCLPRMPELRAG